MPCLYNKLLCNACDLLILTAIAVLFLKYWGVHADMSNCNWIEQMLTSYYIHSTPSILLSIQVPASPSLSYHVPLSYFTHSYSMTRWEWWSLNLINPCSCWPSVGVGLPSLVSRCCLRSLDTLTGTGRLTLMSLCHRSSLLRLLKVWISTSYIPSLSSSFFLYCLILFTAHFLYVHPLRSSALFSCTADSLRRPSWSKCPVV